MAFSSGEVLTAESLNAFRTTTLGVGTTTPITALEINSDDDLTSFTGTGRGAVTITNSDYASGDHNAIDFCYAPDVAPSARIAAEMTSSGSYLKFGTTNSYASGVTNTALTITPGGQLKCTNGSESAPTFSFDGDTNTGIYRRSADEINFTTGGAERFRVGSFGIRGDDVGDVYNFDQFKGNNGTVDRPTFGFDSDINTGMYRIASDQVALSGGGRWGVGASATAPIMNIANTTQVGVLSAVVYDASSQRDHKRNIAAKSASVSLSRILELEPVTFNYVKEKLPLREWAGELGEFETFEGFIAEDAYPEAQMLGWNRREGHDDLNNLTAEELVAEGYTLDEVVPTNIRWNVITTDLVGAVKEQASQIAALVSANAELTARLETLEAA